MAINRATRDLIAFAIMFFTIFLAFVQFGYLIFGTYMQDFSTFGDSMYATFKHFIANQPAAITTWSVASVVTKVGVTRCGN